MFLISPTIKHKSCYSTLSRPCLWFLEQGSSGTGSLVSVTCIPSCVSTVAMACQRSGTLYWGPCRILNPADESAFLFNFCLDTELFCNHGELFRDRICSVVAKLLGGRDQSFKLQPCWSPWATRCCSADVLKGVVGSHSFMLSYFFFLGEWFCNLMFRT